MIFCGWLSAHFGKELNWDMANYHFYNPFALIYHRSAVDYWPYSFVHVHLNPTIDLLTYFLITHFPPRTAEFILGAIHGINFILLFLIARFFLMSLVTPIWQVTISFVLAFLGLYGPTAMPGIGSFQNDNLVSIFVLLFTYLFLWQLKKIEVASENLAEQFCHVSERKRSQESQLAEPGASATGAFNHQSLTLLAPFALAGNGHKQKIPVPATLFAALFLGIGVGLKLTAALFALGALLAILILPIRWQDRSKYCFLLCIGIGAGMLISAGNWMWTSWQQYHNPVFPLLNGLFHSPDFPAYSWRDSRFIPQGFWKNILFPFYFSWDGRSADVPFRDFRFAIVEVLLLCCSLRWLARLLFGVKQQPSPNIPLRWFIGFFIASFIIWQYYFSMMRYIVTLEMLAPILILLLSIELLHVQWQRLLLAGYFATFILLTMSPTQMLRTPYYGKSYFQVKLPEIVSKTPAAMVLMSFPVYAINRDPRPQTYLIPFFPREWRFVGVPFDKEAYEILPEVVKLARQYQGKLFLLTTEFNVTRMLQFAKAIGLRSDGACENIVSDRQIAQNEGVRLCPVRF